MRVNSEEPEQRGDHSYNTPQYGILTGLVEATIFTPTKELGIAPSMEHEPQQGDFSERAAVPGQPPNVPHGLSSAANWYGQVGAAKRG